MTLPAHTPKNRRDDAELIQLLAEHDPPDLIGAAALLELPEAEASVFVNANAQAIEAAARRLALTGGALETKARQLALKLIDRMAVDVDSLDAMDAADLIKHPLRIIENGDRVRMAKKADPNAGLPVFNITFVNGSMTAELVKPADVVDVDAKVTERQGGDHE